MAFRGDYGALAREAGTAARCGAGARAPARPSPAAAPDGRGPARTVKEWTAPLKVRVESREGPDGGEIVRFIGAVTGHEACRLDEDFCARLVAPEDRERSPRFYICGGAPDLYDSCYVEKSDLDEYLRERGPSLFPDRPPSPGM